MSPRTLTIVKAIDGITRFFRLMEKVFVHGAPGTGDELKGLHRGMTVVVHYTGTGQSATRGGISIGSMVTVCG